jgi:hypothetical protein
MQRTVKEFSNIINVSYIVDSFNHTYHSDSQKYVRTMDYNPTTFSGIVGCDVFSRECFLRCHFVFDKKMVMVRKKRNKAPGEWGGQTTWRSENLGEMTTLGV